MMDYAALRDGTVLPMIKEYGFAIKVAARASGGYSAAADVVPADALAEDGYAIAIKNRYAHSDGNIRAAATSWLVAGVTAIRPGDKVSGAGKSGAVVAADEIAPGGEVLAYEVYFT